MRGGRADLHVIVDGFGRPLVVLAPCEGLQLAELHQPVLVVLHLPSNGSAVEEVEEKPDRKTQLQHEIKMFAAIVHQLDHVEDKEDVERFEINILT